MYVCLCQHIQICKTCRRDIHDEIIQNTFMEYDGFIMLDNKFVKATTNDIEFLSRKIHCRKCM